MKLFTKDIDKKLFAQYSKGADLENQKVVAKIFNPYGRGRWYLLNSDPNDPDYIWAIVQMGDDIDVGSISRKELESIKVPPFRLGLERDIYFSEINAAELYRGLFSGKFYKSGGNIDIAEQNKEMLLNYAEELEHHTEEFEKAAKKSENVEPWVVAKMERSTTDLSDVTHYLDSENEKRREYENGEGEEMENGGMITESDIVEGAKFKSKSGTVFVIDKVSQYDDNTGKKFVETSLERGSKGNYRNEIKDLIDFLNEEGSEKYNDESEMAKGGETKLKDCLRLTLSNKDSYDYTYIDDDGNGEITFGFGKEAFQFIVKKISPNLKKYQNKIINTFVLQGIRQHEYKGGYSEAIKHLDTCVLDAQDKKKIADGGMMAFGGLVRNFNKQKELDANSRTEILNVIKEVSLLDGFDSIQNSLYGLFDGYDYSKTIGFKKKLEELKEQNIEIYNKIKNIYNKVDSFRFYSSYKDGGELSDNYIIKDDTNKYYSRNISSGNVKWNDSQDMAYMFKKEEADDIKSKLESEGYKNLTIQKYDKEWWKKMSDGGMMEEGGDISTFDPMHLIGKYFISRNTSGEIINVRTLWDDNIRIRYEGGRGDLIERGFTKEQLFDMFNGKKINDNIIITRDKRMADGGMMAKGGRIYFSSFAEVMDAINDIADENGYKVIDIFPDLSYGGVGYGQTRRAKVELEWNGKEKVGKSKKREKNTMNVQIYRMESGNYELNTYFSYRDGGRIEGNELDFGDFYEWSNNEVNKKFGSSFDEGFPLVKYVKDSGDKIIESASGTLKNGKNVLFDVEEVEWNIDEKMADGGHLQSKKDELLESLYPQIQKLFSKNGLKLDKDYGFIDASNKSYLPQFSYQREGGELNKVIVTYYADGFEVLGEIEIELEDGVDIEIQFPNLNIKEEVKAEKMAKGGGIGFIPMDLEEKLMLTAKWGGTDIKGVIGILNAMIDSDMTDQDLVPKPTKSGSAYEKALAKKTQEIWAKIKPKYKGDFEGNMYYSTILRLVERSPNDEILKRYKPFRKFQKDYAVGGMMAKGSDVLKQIYDYISNTRYSMMLDDYEEGEYITIRDRVAPSITSGDSYDDLVYKIKLFASDLKDGKWGDLIDIKFDYNDEWVGFDIILKQNYKMADGGMMAKGGLINIGTNTKTDSDVYYDRNSKSFYLYVIDGAGSRINKIEANSIDDILKKYPNWKWTEVGRKEFVSERGKMEKGGEVGVTYFIGKPEIDKVGRFGKKRATWKTCVVNQKGDKNYSQYSTSFIGSVSDVKLDGVKVSESEFDKLSFKKELAKGGIMSDTGDELPKIGSEVRARWNDTMQWTLGTFKGETENGFEVYDFTIEKPKYIEYYSQISIDPYNGTKIFKSDKFKDRNYKNYHFKKEEMFDDYAKGGEVAKVGEPYDSMTKYQLEKEYKKLNEKRDSLKKKYGSFDSQEISENEKEIEKIITLLYGEDFSGKGQKFKYADGGDIFEIGQAITNEYGVDKEDGISRGEIEDVLLKEKNKLLKYKGRFIKTSHRQIPNFQEIIDNLRKDGWIIFDNYKMADGGKVTFADKVKSVKSSLLKRKKVSPKVQKDYGKTYSQAEAEDSAKRIVGAMTAKERLMKRLKKGKK